MRSKHIVFLLLGVSCAVAASQSNEPKGFSMKHVAGTFDIKVTPIRADNDAARNANVGRMSLDKQYKGDLTARSSGEMLAYGDGVTSGAYVAIERVTGSLHGRTGSFALAHHSLMSRGAPENWIISVVPDSGTDGLKGLIGAMKIIVEKGQHAYEFEYVLPE